MKIRNFRHIFVKTFMLSGIKKTGIQTMGFKGLKIKKRVTNRKFHQIVKEVSKEGFKLSTRP